jgi:hypothetical protein
LLGFQVSNWSFQTRLHPGAADGEGAAVGRAVGLGEGAGVVPIVGFGVGLDGLPVGREVGAELGRVDEGAGVAVVPGRGVGLMVALSEAVGRGVGWSWRLW